MVTTRAAASLALFALLAVGAGCSAAPTDPDATIVRTLAVDAMAIDPHAIAFDDVDREILLLAYDATDFTDTIVVLDENGEVRATRRLADGPTPLFGYATIAANHGTSEIFAVNANAMVGHRIDLDTLSVTGEFCLEPGYELVMHVFGLAYDPDADRIYVAPAMFESGGFLSYSSLEVYQGATGLNVGWTDLDDLVVDAVQVDPATGAVTLLAEGSVYAFDPAGGVDRVRDLERDVEYVLGGSWVAPGFALDRATGHSWLLGVDAVSAVAALEIR